ncbi:MAG: flagellar basal body-associated FliL family protein, partial [Lachnospiraceae bacterium]|nr:flagellar basal body-associated FliL family protein [Lachnospiraceae bacterium]
AKGADGKAHYCIVSVSLSLNTKDPDFEKYSATLGDNEDMIKDKIFQVVGSHTIEEAESNTDGLREEILEAIQQMYGSKFVYNIVFRDIMFS